jgi:hypothetical protein
MNIKIEKYAVFSGVFEIISLNVILIFFKASSEDCPRIIFGKDGREICLETSNKDKKIKKI